MGSLMNGLANAGLAYEGYNSAEQQNQKTQENDQALQKGQMGLDELKRNTANDVSARRAYQQAQQTDTQNQSKLNSGTVDTQALPSGQAGSLDAIAKAYDAAGDFQKANAARQAKQQMISSGFTTVIHQVMQDDTIGPRPDLAKINNEHGGVIWDPNKTRLEMGDNGERVLVATNAANGLERKIPIGQAAVLAGLVDNKPVKLGANEKLVGPQSGKTIATNDVDQIGAVAGRDGNPGFVYNKKDINNVKTIQSNDTDSSGINIKKDKPILDEINHAIYSAPGMGALDPISGKATPTPDGMRRGVIAQALIQANPQLKNNPNLVADMALHGSPDESSGEKAWKYNGELHSLNFVHGTPIQTKQQNFVQPVRPAQPQQQTQQPTQIPQQDPLWQEKSWIKNKLMGPLSSTNKLLDIAKNNQNPNLRQAAMELYQQRQQNVETAQNTGQPNLGYKSGGKVTRKQMHGLG